MDSNINTVIDGYETGTETATPDQQPFEANLHYYIEEVDALYLLTSSNVVGKDFITTPLKDVEDINSGEERDAKKAYDKFGSSRLAIRQYIDLQLEICDVNSVRGSSYIPTPENNQIQNVDLLI